MNQERVERRLSGILSADVFGYSRLMEDDEEWTIINLEENKKLMARLIKEYNGRIVDATGDNILAEFSSVVNAVECAVKIQKELKLKYSGAAHDKRMDFRIGVNLGDVIIKASSGESNSWIIFFSQMTPLLVFPHCIPVAAITRRLSEKTTLSCFSLCGSNITF